MENLLIFVGIIFVIFILFYNNTIEGLQTMNNRMAVNQFYQYDSVFDNVIYFANTDNSTGWARCKLICPGSCVEYGVSGNSYCFLPETTPGRFSDKRFKDINLWAPLPLAQETEYKPNLESKNTGKNVQVIKTNF